MAKYRIVNTRFWDDAYIARLRPDEKLVFLYLLTNPLTTIAGVYELSVKRASFDTGLPAREITRFLGQLEADGKIVRHEEWIGVVNFLRHQSLNPKVRQGIAAELQRAPRPLTERLPAIAVFVRITEEVPAPSKNETPRSSHTGLVQIGSLLPEHAAPEQARRWHLPKP